MSKTTVDQRAESVTMIPIGEVHAATDNPRRVLGDLTELADSIKANGIIEPLVVVPRDHDGYRVVVGHRRRAAGELAKLVHLPCIVRSYDDQRRQVVMLVENLQREDLGPLEEAAAYQQLVDSGLSQHDIAAQVGRSQAHISKHIALLQLPEKAREAVNSRRISKEDAFELSKLADHPEAIEQALSSPRHGVDVASHARALADQMKSDAARKATKDRLLLEGKRVVGEAESSWIAGPGYPARTLDQVARVASKNFDPAKHDRLGCAGYFITWEGEAIPACADYRKHEAKPRTSAADREEDKEWERTRKERERVAERLQQLGVRRSKYIALLLAGKLGADARDHVVKQAIHVYEPSYDRVCEWLGIDAPEGFDDHPATFLLRWIDDAPSTRQLQASLAMVLEEAEDRLRFNDPRKLDVEEAILFKNHFEFLTFAGYELAPEEQAYLSGDVGAGDPAASRESDEAAPSTPPVAEGSEREAYTQPGAAAPSAVGSPDLEQESLGGDEPPPLSSPLDVSKLLDSVTRKWVRVKKERQLLEAAVETGKRGRPDKADRRQAELRALRESEASLEKEVGELQAIVRRQREEAAQPEDLPVGDFDAEDLAEPLPCPVCSRAACAHTVEEKARAAAAALAGVAVATPKARDPKACRECGCHGDCEGGCSWVDVDEVKGLLCSSHELVPA